MIVAYYSPKNYGKTFNQACELAIQITKLLPIKVEIIVTTSEAQKFWNKHNDVANEIDKRFIFEDEV